MPYDEPDETFLDQNDRLGLVPRDEIERAVEIQARERAEGLRPRRLAAILRSLGVLTADLEARLGPGPEPEAPRTTVLPDETVAVLLSPDSASSMLDLSPVRPDRPARGPGTEALPPRLIGRPAEAEEASRDPRNALGRFILIREVGKGGIGTVYRAWDDSVGRFVAIKVIHDVSKDSVDRFVREAHLAGRLHHPSIATVYGVGRHEGRPFLEMQFIEGEAIGKVPRTVRQTLELVRDAARGLHHAHREGVVHRDIKPGNLLVTREPRIYITDFGLAKQVVGGDVLRASLTGGTVGTPEYMSPEQARGTAEIDPRTDVYGLGVTLYALLAGRPPFREKNIVDLLVSVVERRPPPLRLYNTAISPELEAVIEKAMSKDPGRRFPTAAALADELDRLLREDRFLGRYGLARHLFRKWWPRAAAGVAIGLALRWGWPAWTAPSPPTPTPEDPARLYRAASDALRAIESSPNLPAGERKERVAREVFAHLDRILEGGPDDLAARVLRARALHVAGRETELEAELRDLAPERKRDYRIAFLGALREISRGLEHPPLPAPEAPVPDWEGSGPGWPSDLARELAEVARASVQGPVAEEHRRDAAAARTLLLLLGSDRPLAARALEELTGSQRAPVYAHAWVHAAYRAGRFSELRSHPASLGRRERLGAGLALAMASEQPEKDLTALLEEAREDRQATLLLRAGLARLAARLGKDPEPHVAAGLERAAESGAWDREIRGVLLAARVSWLALSGGDREELYRETEELLGNSPATWMGRQARIESGLAEATRLTRSGGDATRLLEDVRTRADALSESAPEWIVPRLHRGLALLRLGKTSDARTELTELARRTDSPLCPPGISVRIHLAASAAWLATAEECRRQDAPGGELAERSRSHSLAVLGAYPEHPEALNLAAAAALVLAEEAAGRGEDESAFLADAQDRLDRALGRVPDYLSARAHRATALHLAAERARAAGGDGGAESAESLKDLDRALLLMPELSPARFLRAAVRFSLEDYAGARDDWDRLLRRDRRWAPEAEPWLRRSEERLRR